MQFSEYYKQLIDQQTLREQVVQEALYLSQEILLKRTQLTFGALCFFLISQSFTIPILPIGPWAVWPCLTDFAIAYLVITFIQENNGLRTASIANRSILQVLATIILGAIASYIFYISTFHSNEIKGVNFGIFQIYRLLQFTFVFWVSSRIPLDSKRIAQLRQITAWVLLFVCAGIFLTFFAIVPLPIIAAHLPKLKEVAGPWAEFASFHVGEGWGTIGYNHAYVAVQVILLLGLYLHLNADQDRRSPAGFYLIISTVCCFLSGSRSGFAVALILSLFYWLKKPSYFVTMLGLGILAFPFFEIIKWILSASQSTDGLILDRQLTIFDASNPDHLSGRDEIWKHRLEFLDQEPLRWIFGSGFGSAVDSGNNAHMLPLQITVETGLVGLSIFIFLFGLILYSLYHHESGSKAMLITTIVLLISSASQETFYPVPAQGHFLGFYFCCLAISLRNELTLKPSWLLNHPDLNFQTPSHSAPANVQFVSRSRQNRKRQWRRH